MTFLTSRVGRPRGFRRPPLSACKRITCQPTACGGTREVVDNAQDYCATAEAWLKKSVGMGWSNRQVIAIGRSPVWLTYEAGPRNK